MITFFLLLFIMCGFMTAMLVGSTLICIFLSSLSVLAAAAIFAYYGLLFLSSASILIYAGLFIVLFFVLRKVLPEDKCIVKKILIFAFGLFIATSLGYTLLLGDFETQTVTYNFDTYENKVNIIIVLLIIAVVFPVVASSKHDSKIKKKREKNTVRLLDGEEHKKGE